MPASVTQIDLLRHGACKGPNLLRGRTDTELSMAGVTQMRAALEQHGNELWDIVVTSPLQRCASFATQLGLDVAIDDRLREIDFGDWDGRAIEQLDEAEMALLTRFRQAPSRNTLPGAENYPDFCARVEACWSDLLQRYQGRRLLMITHGGVMRLLLGFGLNLPRDDLYRLHIPHACISRLRVYHADGHADWPQLVQHNATGA